MPDTFSRLETALAGRYRIERELGSGGMATVYLADDVKHHRQVAIKVLRAELASLLGADRFLREVQIAAKLNHPHILPLYDSGEADGFLFYVMPYIKGGSLRVRLDEERQLPVDEAIALTRQVASALGHAHARNVIHRDVKPENHLVFVYTGLGSTSARWTSSRGRWRSMRAPRTGSRAPSCSLR